MPEETPLRLSDMYRLKVEAPKLELEAMMLNIRDRITAGSRRRAGL